MPERSPYSSSPHQRSSSKPDGEGTTHVYNNNFYSSDYPPRENRTPPTSSSRLRLLCVSVIVAVILTGFYWHWVSKEMDRISQPSILIAQ
jgi:hypothetical protein